MKYRAEIDGLRALAVLPVILFHAGFDWFSWRFIEAPFRNKNAFTKRDILTFSVVGIVTFSVLGMFFQWDRVLNKSPYKLQNVQFESLAEKIEVLGEVCSDEDIIERSSFSFCELGNRDSDTTIVFYGDSHLQAIQYSLDRKLRLRNIKGAWIKEISACETTIFTAISNNINAKSFECPSN